MVSPAWACSWSSSRPGALFAPEERGSRVLGTRPPGRPKSGGLGVPHCLAASLNPLLSRDRGAPKVRASPRAVERGARWGAEGAGPRPGAGVGDGSRAPRVTRQTARTAAAGSRLLGASKGRQGPRAPARRRRRSWGAGGSAGRVGASNDPLAPAVRGVSARAGGLRADRLRRDQGRGKRVKGFLVSYWARLG